MSMLLVPPTAVAGLNVIVRSGIYFLLLLSALILRETFSVLSFSYRYSHLVSFLSSLQNKHRGRMINLVCVYCIL